MLCSLSLSRLRLARHPRAVAGDAPPHPLLAPTPPFSLPRHRRTAPPDLAGWSRRRRAFLSPARGILPGAGLGGRSSSAGGGPASWQRGPAAGAVVVQPIGGG